MGKLTEKRYFDVILYLRIRICSLTLVFSRYRGSTDDLRRSREDITAPSQIPKLFSPRLIGNKQDDRLKRQDSKDEIRCLKFPAARKDSREISSPKTSLAASASSSSKLKDDDGSVVRGEIKSGIKVFARRGGATENIFETCRVNKTSKELKTEDLGVEDETTRSKSSIGKSEVKESADLVVETVEMVEKKEPPSNSEETIKNDRKFEGFKVWEKAKDNDNDNDNDNENEKETIVEKLDDNDMENDTENINDNSTADQPENNDKDYQVKSDDCEESNTTVAKEAVEINSECNSSKKLIEDYPVVRFFIIYSQFDHFSSI